VTLERDVIAYGLGEVDDVDPIALGEDEGAHLGIPAPSLMSEVDTGLKELAHRSGRHGAWTSCAVLTSARLVIRGPGRDLRLPAPPRGTTRV
jgi:hypothetical protein